MTHESSNGLLIECSPKGESLARFGEELVQGVYDKLNRRLRKRLGYWASHGANCLEAPHLICEFRGESEAACDDFFGQVQIALSLTCGNARLQSHWLRLISHYGHQCGKSTVLMLVFELIEPQNQPVFVPGTKTELQARGFGIVCGFVPGFVSNAYVRSHGGIRRYGGHNRRPN